MSSFGSGKSLSSSFGQSLEQRSLISSSSNKIATSYSPISAGLAKVVADDTDCMIENVESAKDSIDELSSERSIGGDVLPCGAKGWLL